jgi:glycosyltransferase involved in cell wall biosynthesis
LNLPELPTICYTGRLHEAKGLDVLISACAAVQKGGRRCQLLLVGDGPERAKLEAQANEGGDPGMVRFIGAVDDVEPYLRASDLFALPSRFEGLSVSLLEAMALGMPCIASDIAANREVATAPMLSLASVGGVSDWKKSLEAILSSSGGAGVEGRREHIRRRFSLDAVAETHLSLFGELTVSRAR